MTVAASSSDSRRSDGSGNYHVNALTRGLQILELLGSHRAPLTLIALHNESKLPKSTLVRLLSALAEQQFIVRVDDRPAYRLGHKVLDLGQAYVGSLDISDAARSYLSALAAATGHTANLGVLDGAQVLHVAVEATDRPLRFESRVGDRAPTYCTGLGKMLLASLPADELRDSLPAKLVGLTSNTITSRAGMMRELSAINDRGYATDNDEHSVGLSCVSVPVTTTDGRIVAAVSVSGASGEFQQANQRSYLRHLRRTASALGADPEVIDALRSVPISSTTVRDEP